MLKACGIALAAVSFSGALAAAGDPGDCFKGALEQERSDQTVTDPFRDPGPLSPEARVEAENIEREAIQVLHDLVLSPEKAEQSLKQWFEGVRSHQNAGTRHLSVMEHTTLVHLLRSGFLRDNPDATLVDEIKKATEQSWLDLTGERRDLDYVLDHPLPETTMSKASHDERLFQTRVMSTPKDSIGSTVGSDADINLSEKKSGSVRAYAFKSLVTAAAGFSLTSGAAHALPGGDALAAGIIGYITGSNLEVLLHRYFMHATPEMLKLYGKLGFIGRILQRSRRNHLIHHTLFPPKRYTTAASEWADAEDLLDESGAPTGMKTIPRFDKALEENGHKPGEGQRNKYGLTLDNLALGNVEAIMLSVSNALSYALFGFHDLPGWLALNAGVQYSVFGVRTLHSLLHMRPESYPPVFKYLLRFKWVRDYLGWVSRHHFQHHANMKTNFPLFMPFFPNGEEPDLRRLLLMWSLDVIR